MSSTDNGGPAFPCEELWDNGREIRPPSRGMDLRDWFAGQALAGEIQFDATRSPENLAKDAYRTADAMLAERAKEQSQ